MKIIKKSNGFTLIELLVVMGIIAMLSLVLVVNLEKAKVKSRDAQRKSDLTKIAQALDTYKIDYKAYPAGNGANFDAVTSTSLSALITANNAYLSVIPVDPMNSNNTTFKYSYRSDGSQFKIKSVSEGITASDITDVASLNCGATCCNTVDVLKQKAGDYCNPVAGSYNQFQISSNNTSLGW